MEREFSVMMNKVNYNELFENIINVVNKNKKPTLLVQCCCAPCSTAVLERVLPYFSVTLFYYNPNITNEAEFYFREKELVKLVTALNEKMKSKTSQNYSKLDLINICDNNEENILIKTDEVGEKNKNEKPNNISEIKFVSLKFNPEKFINISKGYENENEGGNRCKACYALRLNETATFAKKNNFDYFCSTLSVSPYKNAKVLNKIGFQLQNEIGVTYLPNDFKKNNGFLRSVKLSDFFELYRQNYCGCEYSKQKVSAK